MPRDLHSTRLLLPLALALASGGVANAADAADAATVSINGETKQTEGVLRSAEPGDMACYLSLETVAGESFDEMAAFELCEDPALIGQRLKLTYAVENVLAAECQGDMDCGKSDQVVMITKAEPLGAMPTIDVGKNSFCTATETVVFACRSGKKLVSVCASNDASVDSGYLQYHFGKPDSAVAPELTLPASQSLPPQSAHGENVAYSGGGGSWLRFSNGKHAYVVYTGIGRWGVDGETMEKQGVQVEHNGEVVANLPCSGPLVSELGPEWFERMGINAAGQEFFFPE